VKSKQKKLSFLNLFNAIFNVTLFWIKMISNF